MKQIFLILYLLPFLLVPAAAQQSKSVFIPGDAYTAYNIPAGGSALQLNINRANNNLVIDDSEILLQDASDAVQWYRSSAGPALHVYQIGTVLSSREYVHVFGHYHYTNGSGGGTPPTFNAKVAAPDVDMTSVAEEDEESVGIWLGKNGARKPVTIQAVQCKGPGNEQVLAWSSGKLSLWSAASGGSMLSGNSKSLSASQDYTYYAQGDVASGSVRDSEISITYTGGNGTACDKIKLTVVHCTFTAYSDNVGAIGHGWWRFGIEPVDATTIIDPPNIRIWANTEAGYFPYTVGDPHGPGKVVMGNQGHTPTSQHTWDIPFILLDNGLTYCRDLDASPGIYDILVNNCCHKVIAASSTCGVNIPSDNNTPEKLHDYLNGL